MIKGHLDQTQKNARSTRTSAVFLPDGSELQVSNSITEDYCLSPDPGNHRTHYCYAATIEPTGQIYTDQTGKFVAPSSNGNNYLFVLYDYDSNCIIAEPMKTHTGPSILAAYTTLHTTLVAAGL
jgi:hypothetical protein